MNIALLLSNRTEIIRECKEILSPDSLVISATSIEDCVEHLGNYGADVVLLDFGSFAADLPKLTQAIRKMKPDLGLVGIFPEETTVDEIEDLAGEVYDYLQEPLSPMKLRGVVSRSLERQSLLETKQLCERPGLLLSPSRKGIREVERDFYHAVPSFSEKALRELSKALTASFDLDRLLNLFVDSVVEVLRTSKISILLLEEGWAFRVKASRGIKPELVADLQFKADDELPVWLGREGRILRKPEVLEMGPDPEFRGLARQMDLLQCAISVPLLSKGRLIGFLSLNQKVTGIPFSNDELEVLFTLASHLAVAIQDIFLYQQMHYQKTYSQKILAHMSNGVVTIDKKERIIIFNYRAEEILGRRASEMLGKDLRYLPSPLGDLLYEAMKTGATHQKREISLFQGKLPLEISTYPLVDEQQNPMGSVILFEDISSRKRLEEERKRADRLNILNELLARMAHEIKNPLVAIRTFTQLLQERYEDPDFKNFFYTTVSQEVEKINDLVEKLVAFVHPLDFRYELEDLRNILDNSLFLAWEQGISKEVEIVKDFGSHPLTINADKEQMSKAFSYIILHAVGAMPKGGKLILEAEEVGKGQFAHSAGLTLAEPLVRISVRDTGQGITAHDLDKLFDPFRTTEGFGVGLGLPLSQKIIEEHGGKIEVMSEVGKGTSFHIYLPCVAEEVHSNSLR
ncbi:MAG: ATP-binding protein [bacterium]